MFSENIQVMSEKFFHDSFVCDLSGNYNATHTDPVIAENCKYRDALSEMQKNDGNYEDAKQLYIRGWLQTVNLAIGCIALGILVYRQK